MSRDKDKALGVGIQAEKNVKDLEKVSFDTKSLEGVAVVIVLVGWSSLNNEELLVWILDTKEVGSEN